MARERTSRLFPIAVSPSVAADMLGVDLKVITRAVKAGELPLYQHGRTQRIPVLSIVFWIEMYWIKVGGSHAARKK